MDNNIQVLLNTMTPQFGREWYIDPVNGSDSNTGETYDQAFKTLPFAYAKMSANKNEVLYFIGGASSLSLGAAFDWNKNFTHFVGLGSILHNGGRCRISHSANFTPVFTISARGCQFANIHFQHGRGNASNLIGVSLTYSGNSCNSFYNCDFEGPLHATEAAAAFITVNIASGCCDNTFTKCRFGQWTVEADLSSGTLVKFNGQSSVTTFDDCTFMAPSTNAGFVFINAAANLGGGNALVVIKNCRFIQLYDTTLTKVITPPASGQGEIILHNCMATRVTDWATAASTVWSSMPAASESGGIGTQPA